SKRIEKRTKFTVDDHVVAWKFIYEKLVEADKEGVQLMPKGIAFWNDFVRVTRSSKSATNWSSHFRKIMCPGLHEMPLHKKTILYLLKNIGIEIDKETEQIIERKFNVKLLVGIDRNLISYKLLDA
uniref:Double-strand telomeric DNA-binding proteins 2 n=1 Tax=Caenorhabditis elegans TaxID=6239 RepID=UPI0030BA2B0A